MGRKELLIALYDYGAWAYEKLFAKIGELSDEQYRKVWSRGYQSIHDTLVHNFGADSRWLSRWQGDPSPAMLNPAELSSLAEIKGRWADIVAKRKVYLESLSEGQLDEEIVWQRGSERVRLPR
ncbi:MAG: DinB family protein [Chloroflexi bacterium]|nr:DinB family protein [Chloroflexota bacterium]